MTESNSQQREPLKLGVRLSLAAYTVFAIFLILLINGMLWAPSGSYPILSQFR